MVHYRLGDGTCRPAVVTHVHDDGTLDMQMFTNGPPDEVGGLILSSDRMTAWLPSINEGEESHFWHDPRECKAASEPVAGPTVSAPTPDEGAANDEQGTSTEG